MVADRGGLAGLTRSRAWPAGLADPLGCRRVLETSAGAVRYYSLEVLERRGMARLERLPSVFRILLENVLRHAADERQLEAGVRALLGDNGGRSGAPWLEFFPTRVLLQDHSGLPLILDLAAMRSQLVRRGLDPGAVDFRLPTDLVIDHSVQVDFSGSPEALERNLALEYERNQERYRFLRWASFAFSGLRVVPPGRGIVHQINLERLASVVTLLASGPDFVAAPDTLVGTDSHTPMVNGLGVLGWGVGGIEAEAAVLGQPLPIPRPRVVGIRLGGELEPDVTATDLVLTLTERLRGIGVVSAILEFYGEGCASLAVPDRATVSNMAPEFGATAALFPIDQRTVDYLRTTGRDPLLLEIVQRYARAQGLFREAGQDPDFEESIAVDLGEIEPSLAGPHRPQERTPLSRVWQSFIGAYPPPAARRPAGSEPEQGAVAIAAITSCTNTSNLSGMLAAGLLARKAVELGLSPKPWVKTSLAPGSRVVRRYLAAAGLLPSLEALGFNVVGFGCTTCIGNSGPLLPAVEEAIERRGIKPVAVLSGNRNFEGRIHSQISASYLASPPLVVAYALAGTIAVDLTAQPLGRSSDGPEVYLRDIWPRAEEIEALKSQVTPGLFQEEYGRLFESDERWESLAFSSGPLFEWNPGSTYIVEPPIGLPAEAASASLDLRGARVLALLGDRVTTDHISPAGAIAPDSPAGLYLRRRGVAVVDFNTYGCRRGNREVMIAGTFANRSLCNHLVPGTFGGVTRHIPSGSLMTIPEAAEIYRQEQTPLLVVAGREYGMGSSRDWAAKGVAALGVRVVLAESFERIHRSNLIGCGVLPLQFRPGESWRGLGLRGSESYDVACEELAPGCIVTIRVQGPEGQIRYLTAICRIDSPLELAWYLEGGIVAGSLRRVLESQAAMVS